MTRRTIFLLATGAVAALGLSGCVANQSTDSAATTISVESTAQECDVSAPSASSGTIVFSVTNSGDQETEFYLLAEDGLQVVGEVEHIGPGTSRDLVVAASPGTYFTVCKPGMSGNGVGKTEFSVTE